MFDVRLRKFEGTGTKGHVLKTLNLSTSIQESGVASLKFTVSEHVAGRMSAPFLVGVEYSTGGAYVQPRNGLFIVNEEGSDSADVSKAVEFSGVPFVPWLLEGMHQRMNKYTGAKYQWAKTEWPDATPGRILRSLIDHGKSVDGWAPMLTTDFTATADSAGAAWTAAEKWSPEFARLTSIADVLESHTNSGLVDWWTEGTKLRLFRPGTGTVYPNVKLGGPGFQRMPTRRQYEGQFNFLTVIAVDGVRYYTNPGADETFGKRHATATLSGVKLADADRIAAPMLVEGRTAKRELSYEWTPAGQLPVPWVDFQVGDAVSVRDRSSWTEQRVLGITVSKSETGVMVRATVGAKLLNRLKRAVEKIDSGTLGQITGGTGVAIPSTPTVALGRPAVPGGVRVASNTAVWGVDGAALTTVKFAWNEVIETVDGADLEGATYEVWGRRGSDAAARIGATDALEFTVTGWESGTPRYVKVRALDSDGRPGAFSAEIAVTPVAPSSIVPKAPTGLAVVSNTGAFQQDGTAVSTVALGWAPVTLSVDSKPVTVDEYEVLYGLESVRVRTASATITIPARKALQVTVRALSNLGVWGDPSTPLGVTGALPVASTVAPSAPVVTAGMGGITYRWDGLSSTGRAMPAGTARVVVDTAPAAAGPWTALGTPLTAAGGGTVAGTVGAAVHVRFRAFDTLGRLMGTSVSASAVVAGVALGDIPDLEGELDGIRFTADGKNRIYVQKDSPGENLLSNGGFEQASGTVEVRRNLALNPNAVAGGATSFSTNNAAHWTVTREAVGTTTNPQGITTRAKSQVVPGAGRAEVLSMYNIDGLSTSGPARAIGAWFYVNASGYHVKISGTAGGGTLAPLPAGTWVWVTGTAAAGEIALAFVRKLSGTAADSDIAYITGVTALTGTVAPTATIAGGTTYPDGDLTPSWTGPVNASETTLTGDLATGVADRGAIATPIRSSAWALSGTKSLRIIPKTTGSYASLVATGLTVGKTYTVMANAHLEAAQTGALAANARSLYTDFNPSIRDQAPNVAGTHLLRIVVEAASSSVTVVLYNGSASTDIWYDDLTLIEGEAEKPFTPGDLWLQLDESKTSVTAIKVWNGVGWAPQVLYAQDIIAAGSITGMHVETNSLGVNHVSPSFGDDLNLEANGSINLLVGRVNANADELLAHQVALEAQAAQTANVQAAAETAAEDAAIAAITAAAAEAAAAAAQADVDRYGTVFTFEPDGFGISAPGSPLSVKLTNANIAIRRNGVTQTQWDEQQMIVPKLKTAQMIVGQTVITEDAGRTSWQRL